MNRRVFLVAVAALPALAWIDPARAQSAKAPGGKVMRVGILRHSGTPSLHTVFVDTLRELGWIEGRNVVYDIASTDGDDKRLPEVAAALVARRPDVIYASNNPLVLAALGQTRTIPIVFAAVFDPVGAGFVKSLRMPGGNVTGVANIAVEELAGRRLQLLKEVLPKTTHVGVLMAGGRSSSSEYKVIEQAAGRGVRISPAVVKDPADVQAVFSALLEKKPEALLLTQTPLFMAERKRILELAARHRLPVVAPRSEQADEGALMSYNSNLVDHARRAAYLADKILRGTKPGDIPVEHPTNFELVINLRTAKALGITIPQSVLLQASRVIE